MKPNSLIDAIDSVLSPLAEARGLPNCVYTDPDYFRLERDAVIGRTWAGIAFGSELPSAGYAKPVDFMGQPLLIVRDRGGELKVFHNVCSHRGMVLVNEEVALKTVLRCPYHSWSYDLDGRLLSTPHVGGVDNHDCTGFDRTEHGLRPVRCATWMDIVFVNMSGEAKSFDAYLAPLLRRWEPFVGTGGFGELFVAATGSYLELEVRSNWKLPVENYCEAYHLPWIHPALNSYSPLDQHYNIVDEPGMSGQGSYQYRPSIVSSQRLPRFAAWPSDRLNHAEYISLYPNVLLGLQADHAFAVIVMPRDTGDTQEKLQLGYVGQAAMDDQYAACREAVLQSWKVVFSEDVFAVEGMQRGRTSPGFGGGVFTPVQDVPTHHFHSWVAAAYRDAMLR